VSSSNKPQFSHIGIRCTWRYIQSAVLLRPCGRLFLDARHRWTRRNKPQLGAYLNLRIDRQGFRDRNFFPHSHDFPTEGCGRVCTPLDLLALGRQGCGPCLTTVAGCPRVPKVEVAGSNPVPRSNTIKLKFRTAVLTKPECGTKLRSVSHTFPHFSPRLAEFNFSHEAKLRSAASFPQI